MLLQGAPDKDGNSSRQELSELPPLLSMMNFARALTGLPSRSAAWNNCWTFERNDRSKTAITATRHAAQRRKKLVPRAAAPAHPPST